MKTAIDKTAFVGHSVSKEKNAMEMTLPVNIFFSIATLLVSIGGAWFVVIRRFKELEAKIPAQDAKFDAKFDRYGCQI